MQDSFFDKIRRLRLPQILQIPDPLPICSQFYNSIPLKTSEKSTQKTDQKFIINVIKLYTEIKKVIEINHFYWKTVTKIFACFQLLYILRSIFDLLLAK